MPIMANPSENPQANAHHGVAPPPPNQPQFGAGAAPNYSPPQQGYYHPQGYPHTQYGQPLPPQQGANIYYTQNQSKGFSITALVLGLTSLLFGVTILVPIAALIFGLIGLRKEPTGKGMALVGVIVGGFSLAVALFLLLFFGGILGGVLSLAVG